MTLRRPSPRTSLVLALLSAGCRIDSPVGPLLPPDASTGLSPAQWVMSPLGSTSYGGSGRAILTNGLTVGSQGGLGTGAAVFGLNAGPTALPALKASHTVTMAYDVAQMASGTLAVGLSTSTVEGQTDNRAVQWRISSAGSATVQDLGLPNGLKNAVAKAISDRGVVVGYGWVNPGDHRSFRRDANGVHTVIHQSSVLSSFAVDVNDPGVVVGTMTTTGHVVRGYRWPVQAGEFTIMQSLQPLPGHHTTSAVAISPSGTIVGYSAGSSGRVAVKWLAGSTTAVDLGVGSVSESRAISPTGFIVARRDIPNGREIVIVAPWGDTVVLPTPVVGYYEAWGINTCGDVVGSGPVAGATFGMFAVRWKAQSCL